MKKVTLFVIAVLFLSACNSKPVLIQQDFAEEEGSTQEVSQETVESTAQISSAQSTVSYIASSQTVVSHSKTSSKTSYTNTSSKSYSSLKTSSALSSIDASSSAITSVMESQTSEVVVSTIDENISLVSITPIVRGEAARVNIKGKPNTEYSITVYYSSGASQASGLENKISNEAGEVSWTWKVGGKTKVGIYYLLVKGDGEELKVEFTVQ